MVHRVAAWDDAGREGRRLFAAMCSELSECGSAQIPPTLEAAEALAAAARQSNEIPAVIAAAEHALAAWRLGLRAGYGRPAKRVNARIYRAARVSTRGAIAVPSEMMGWAE